MGSVKDTELVRYTGWALGIENLNREADLTPASSRTRDGKSRGQLRVAENVDIDDSGKISRRRPYLLHTALPDLHSLAAHPTYPLMLGVYNGYVVSWDTSMTRTNVYALTYGTKPMSVDFVGGYAYYTNGFECGRVDSDGARTAWAVPAPLGQPILAATAAGGLAAGNYQVAITYLDITGRESGSTLAEEVTLIEGQGLALSAIPQPPSGQGVVAVRLYVSQRDGATLYFYRDLAVGMTTASIGVHTPGKALETQFLEPLPPGEIVRFWNGRQLVASGPVLYWSEALMYGQGRLQANYVRFNAPITMVAPVGQGAEAGLFVAAGERTYYLSGADPKAWRRQIVDPHGAVPGSQLEVDGLVLGMDNGGNVQYWLSTEGQFMVGTPGGQVQALHKDRFVAPVNVERATTVLREVGGLRHMLTVLRGGNTSAFAVTDTADAEIWKNGVRVG